MSKFAAKVQKFTQILSWEERRATHPI